MRTVRRDWLAAHDREEALEHTVNPRGTFEDHVPALRIGVEMGMYNDLQGIPHLVVEFGDSFQLLPHSHSALSVSDQQHPDGKPEREADQQSVKQRVS